ncbi:Sec63 Brl domain-containing protein [Pisolithus marmoratus]|nr:Sec63 Brl domain-containing protein [Pisolithus marmoratus]
MECLKDSIGYYHEAMDNQDICIVKWLFQFSAIQVLVISKYYEGREHRCVDYGHTCRDCHKKFILVEGLPIESHLLTHPIILCHYFPAEIVVKTIENKQDTMNYYNLHNVSHQHLSDHLSEPVENTLQDLSSFKIYDCVPIKLDHPGFEAPHFMMFVLLQAHFLHIQLPADLTADQALVLEMVLNVLSTCVDVMSSHAWLNALGAMDLSQMYVQSVWEMDCPLKQSPHFAMEKKGIESVYDIMEMEDDKQNAFLQIDMWKTVVALLYPLKMVNQWLVIGEPSMRQLHVIKHVTVSQDLWMKLEFSPPEGTHSLKLCVICDSYIGTDHDLSIDPIDVTEGKESLTNWNERFSPATRIWKTDHVVLINMYCPIIGDALDPNKGYGMIIKSHATYNYSEETLMDKGQPLQGFKSHQVSCKKWREDDNAGVQFASHYVKSKRAQCWASRQELDSSTVNLGSPSILDQGLVATEVDNDNDVPYCPFHTASDFEFVEITLAASLNQVQVDKLLDLIFHVSKAVAAELTPFSRHDVKTSYKKEVRTYEVFTCPVWEWALDLLQNEFLALHFVWNAQHLYKYNGDNFEQFYDELWMADRWWDIQVYIPNAAPFGLIIYADKTKLSSFGTAKGYPVVVQCANLPVEIWNSHTVPEDAAEEGWLGYTNLKQTVWHESFVKLLGDVAQFSQTGYLHVSQYDKVEHWLFPVVLMLSADYEEQCMMPLIRGHMCKCPCLIRNSDPHTAISFDHLHASHDGVGGRHVLHDMKIILHALGHDAEAEVENYIFKFPRWHGLSHFKSAINVTFSDGNKKWIEAELLRFDRALKTKGATRNYSMCLNESMHGPLKEAYEHQSNGRAMASQLLRMCIDHHMNWSELQAQGLDGDLDPEESTDGPAAFKVQKWIVIPPNFKEFKYLKVNYKSLVDWKLMTDHLWCNPMFYGVPWYDCAIIQLTEVAVAFIHLICIFSCKIPGIHSIDLALVQPFTAKMGGTH